MRAVTTIDGETIDLLAWRVYGTRTGAVEAILDANQHLASQTSTLPVGLDIILPELTAAREATVALWPAP